jgi:hypothetical protein
MSKEKIWQEKTRWAGILAKFCSLIVVLSVDQSIQAPLNKITTSIIEMLIINLF